MKRLEIGPGDCPLDGWDTLDSVACPGVTPTYISTWGVDPLPIKDNFYDLVYASHVLEHIPWMNTVNALSEVHRILKPGGSFECWVPDFRVIVQAYLDQKVPDDWNCHGLVTSPTLWCAARIYSYPKHDLDSMLHRALFDREHLEKCLTEAGFRNLTKLENTRGHDHGQINLGIVCYK